MDQRIEGKAWSAQDPLTRAKIAYFRRLETRAYSNANYIVTLTQDAKDVITRAPSYSGAPVDVIPCSVDQSAFDIAPTARARARARVVLKRRLKDPIELTPDWSLRGRSVRYDVFRGAA